MLYFVIEIVILNKGKICLVKKNILTLLVVLTVLTGCFKQDTLNPNAMTYKESQSVLSIKRGVVIGVEQALVAIDGSDGVSAVSGIVGGLLGSQVGKGTGRDVGIGVGILGGAILGKTLTEKSELAFVYTVELQNNAGIMQIAQTGQMLPQRSKVLIRTFSGGRKTITLDQSQGVTFSETNKTSYQGDAAKVEQVRRQELFNAKQRAAAALKRAEREEAEYQLELESKKLNLEGQRLDIKSKSKRVDRTDEYIDKELKN
ncbi:MAG: outer membrane lipoprotein SlyB [Alphaproteobacteria bacterium]